MKRCAPRASAGSRESWHVGSSPRAWPPCAQSSCPSSCLVRTHRRGGVLAGVGPTFLKENVPHQPQICACVQPLLANTSLSNHLIFTSSVYTLADGFQVNESPAAAVDGCHGAPSAHKKQGRLFTVPYTREGKTTVSTFLRGPGLRRLPEVFSSLSLVPL